MTIDPRTSAQEAELFGNLGKDIRIMKTIKLFASLVTAAALMAAPAAYAADSSVEAPASAAEAPEGAMNVYVLAGPTGIGAMNLWAASDEGTSKGSYNITMTGANDEVVAAISNGQADVSAIATNLAATLYNKTGGGITVLAVNTLGVLSILMASEPVASIADLAGKTIYLPGQGANPEYILRYVLAGNGLDPDADVDLQFVSEGSELLGVWAEDPDAVIMAPQPVATSILMQNEGSSKAFDMTEEWSKVSGGDSTLMMGCVVVRDEYLEDHKEEVLTFLEDYQASIEAAVSDVEGTAALCEKYGLIPKAPLAMKAIPECGITFVTGDELREQLTGYLQVMFDAAPKSVGGAMPGEDFFFAG